MSHASDCSDEGAIGQHARIATRAAASMSTHIHGSSGTMLLVCIVVSMSQKQVIDCTKRNTTICC